MVGRLKGIHFVLFVGLLLVPVAVSAETILAKDRVWAWTSTEGVTIKATFVSLSEDRKTLEIKRGLRSFTLLLDILDDTSKQQAIDLAKGEYFKALVATPGLQLKTRSKVYDVEFFRDGRAVWHYRDGIKLEYDWVLKGNSLAMSRESRGERSEGRYMEFRLSFDKKGKFVCKGKNVNKVKVVIGADLLPDLIKSTEQPSPGLDKFKRRKGLPKEG